jgi:Fe-S-cluster containining protein
MSENQQLCFECERCGNCCTDQNTIVNVTYDDIRRIRDALDLTLEELNHILAFYVFEEKMDEEDKKKMVVSPVETEKGLAFVGLRKKHDGACYFYDKQNKKCRIYKARPAFCRTFPFSFEVIEESDETLPSDIKIKYTEKGKQYCPGIGEGHPKIDRQKWLKRGKKTIEELNKNYHIMEKWNEAVKKGEVEKSAMNFLKTILKAKEEESSSL